MALRYQGESPKKSQPSDILLVIHDFEARSPDELSLTKGDRIELIETDQDFGDGWYLGKHLQDGRTGLFPEVYTTTASRTVPYSSLRPVAGSSFTKDSLHFLPSTESSRIVPGGTIDGTIPVSMSPKYGMSSINVNSGRSTQGRDSAENRGAYGHVPSPLSTSQANQRVASMPNATYASQSMTSNSPSQRSASLMTNGSRTDNRENHVMNETMTVIDEHITNMSTPRSSVLANDSRFTNDSGSEYSNIDHRSSYIHGSETDEEERNTFSMEDVVQWTPQHVANYLIDVGVEPRHCEIFLEQEIDGEVLLQMNQADVFTKEFDLGVVGRRLRTWHKIRAFQEEVRSFNAPLSSRNGTLYGDAQSLDDPSAPVSAQLPQSPFGTPMSPATNTHEQVTSVAADAPHKRQSSYDPNWSMSTPDASKVNRATALTQPSISELSGLASSEDTPQPGRNKNTAPVTTPEPDQGYTSGGELDNKKVRNVLRKKDPSSPPGHVRHSIYKEILSTGLAVNKRHSRFGSTGSIRDALSSVTSGGNKGHMRSASAKEEGTVWISEESSKASDPPIVTKLEYPISPTKSKKTSSMKNDSPSSNKEFFSSMLRFHSNSQPAPPSSVRQSEGITPSDKTSAMSPMSNTVEPAESLRTLTSSASRTSESMADSERPSTVSPTLISSPAQSSPKREQDPSDTASAAKSDNPKSGEFEREKTFAKPVGLSTLSFVPISVARRKKHKNKKQTSAFLQGLRSITPQEALKDCDYSGWMKKKSIGIMSTWKPRLFVLQGRRLAYYYSEDDTEERGLMDISSHRVVRADNEFLTGIHAAMTGAKSSPTSPMNAQTATMNALDAAAIPDSNLQAAEPDGIFIFKLMPPRPGLARAVSFTQPTTHYFAVDNIKQGRFWMAALMKATIDRDDTVPVVMTTQQKTISLSKARAMRQRPPALMNLGEQGERAGAGNENGDGKTEHGLNIGALNLTPEEIRQVVQAEKTYFGKDPQAIQMERDVFGDQNPARVPLPAGDNNSFERSRPSSNEGKKLIKRVMGTAA